MPKKKKSNGKVAIPPMIEVSKAAKSDVRDAEKSLELVRCMAITSSNEYETAVQWVAEVKDVHDAVDTKRKSFTDPLRQVIRDLDAFFKPALDSLKESERVIKEKLVGYVDDCAIKRDQLLTNAGDASKHGDNGVAESLIVEAEAFIPPKVAGLALKQSWDGEVVDIARLPREYLIPDLKALRARTKSTGGDPRIPGWRAFPQTTVAVSVDKVER